MQRVPAFYSLGNLHMPRNHKPQTYTGIVPVIELICDSVHQPTILYGVRDRSAETLVITREYHPKRASSDLYTPLSYDDQAHDRFCWLNRIGRKGMSVLAGSRMDTIRYAWFDLQSFIARRCVRLGLRRLLRILCIIPTVWQSMQIGRPIDEVNQSDLLAGCIVYLPSKALSSYVKANNGDYNSSMSGD